jgi:hypothetical protein
MIESCIALLLSFSLHLNLEGNYNSIHPQIECEKNTIIYGAYYNSQNRMSLYAGTRIPLRNEWELDLVVASGYNTRDIQPMLRLKRKNFYIAPTYETINNNNTNYGILIGVEIKLK